MGFKLLKEKFGIHQHQVRVTPEGICIGSGYVHNLVTIDRATGNVEGNPTFSNFLKKYYPNLLAASSEEVLKLIEAQDVFTVSTPVFTYEDGEIFEKQCEQPGYPNVTHDGDMMYDNTHSTDKEKVVAWAKSDIDSAIESTLRQIARIENDLIKLKELNAGYEAARVKLHGLYPEEVDFFGVQEVAVREAAHNRAYAQVLSDVVE